MSTFRKAVFGFIAMTLWANLARAQETRAGYASIYGLELLCIKQVQQELKLDAVQAEKLADYYQDALARFNAETDELNRNRVLLPREEWEKRASQSQEFRQQ